jgi:hypothetical protein
MATKIQFTLRGRSFTLDREDFLKALEGVEPDRIHKYSTVVNVKRYPIKQVLSAGTGLRKTDFTASDANRLLKKFGFRIDTEGNLN